MPPGSWRNCGSRALLTSRRPLSATRCTSAPSGSAPHCVAVRRIIRCPFLRSVDLSGFQADANLLTELCGNVDQGVKREAGDTAMQEVVGMELVRSEEHTSELQSLMRISYAVFCLKKKMTNIMIHTQTQQSITY